MKKLLIRLLGFVIMSSVFNAHGMTPKYPYEPVTTPCLNEVTLAGEAVLEGASKKQALRLQADLTIIETPNIPGCPSMPNIKLVFLAFTENNLQIKFDDLVGNNMLVTGSIQSGDVHSLKQVTFTTRTITPIE
ncbi:hypothetical protein N8Z26_07310 [Burkholderiales bacterium]|nr:hypothetical protein [Burkholderiales bacterium]